MIDVRIDAGLKNIVLGIALGVVRASVTVAEHDATLWHELDDRIGQIMSQMRPDTLSELEEVGALRSAYRSIGKDASRYRGSAEALLRRVLQGKALYQVNTLVDVNNLLSLETLRSVGSYDFTKVTSPIVLRIGRSGEAFKGIGKDMINIEGLPVFADNLGPFGSPTSDSERTKITQETNEVLLILISFTGAQGLAIQTKRAEALLRTYCAATLQGTWVFE